MRRWKLGLAVVILLIGTGLRLHRIADQSLWHDEGNSLRLAERDVNALIDATGRDIHPPGYYLVLKGWTTIVGTSELGLRSLSMFWSVITLAAVMALGRAFSGWYTASLAGLLLAVQPFAIYYAQETRMYAQLGALSMLSLWVLWRFLGAAKHQWHWERHWEWGRKWHWALALALINTLGLYTHYTYPFTMLAQGIYVVWASWPQTRKIPMLGQYVALNLLTLLLFAPWFSTAYDQITTWPTTGDTTTFTARMERVFAISVYGNTATDLAWVVYVLPLGLFVVAIFAIWKRPALLLPMLLCAFSVGSLLLSGAYREANLKFLLPAQAAFVILIAAGLAQIGRIRPPFGWLGASVLVLILLAPFNDYLDRLYNDTAYQRSDYRTISTLINTLETDDSAVILNAPNQQEVFSYYFDGDSTVIGLPRGLGGDDGATRAETEAMIQQNNRIFLVLWGQQERDPNAVVQSTLDSNAYVVGRQWITDVELVQYAILDAPPSRPLTPLDVQFGDMLTLTGFSLSAETFVAGRGDVLGVTLYWQADAPVKDRYAVSVQVLRADGVLADQHDSEPANNLRPTTSFQPHEVVLDNHGLILNHTLSAGQYTLNVVVYDTTDPNQRLQPSTGEPNAIVQLATLALVAP